MKCRQNIIKLYTKRVLLCQHNANDGGSVKQGSQADKAYGFLREQLLAGNYDPEADDESDEANARKAIRLVGIMSALVAAIRRLRDGEEPLDPKPGASHASNFMYMLNGREPSADEARAMDLILILHAEHGFNASTFSARVICATLTDMYSAITGAVFCAKG